MLVVGYLAFGLFLSQRSLRDSYFVVYILYCAKFGWLRTTLVRLGSFALLDSYRTYRYRYVRSSTTAQMLLLATVAS
jgi:hypothetical protein